MEKLDDCEVRLSREAAARILARGLAYQLDLEFPFYRVELQEDKVVVTFSRTGEEKE
jgi:hypothetical protein